MQYETNLYKTIGYESSDVFRFDLGLLLQSQMRVAKLIFLIFWQTQMIIYFKITK